MTDRNCLYLLASLIALIAMAIPVFSEDDVTVISTPTSPSAPQKKTAGSDDPTVVHKSSHKKKSTATASTTGTNAPTVTVTSTAPALPQVKPPVTPTAPVKPAPAVTTIVAPIKTAPPVVTAVTPAKPAIVPPTPTKPMPAVTSAPLSPAAPVKTVLTPTNPSTGLPMPGSAVTVTTPAGSPAVETGLPVARYPGMGAPIRGVSTYTAIPMTIPSQPNQPKIPGHQPYLASALPVSVLPLTTSAAGTYSNPPKTPGTGDFTFVNFPKKSKMTYPWRSSIITTTFWIGEGDTPISRTTNVQSSWDEEWLSRNRGSDSPNDRNGYAAGSHASTLNPFYVALPFNDLAFPDKARRWLPGGWSRRPVDGKQVSACKDRWVEIKNGKGDVCYAQWEDVGPLGYADAEYVFGGARPTGMGDNHAGLDVSPAVAEYLNISDRNHLTSWRFVDDEDVRPGAWLKLDEQAVLYTALHQFKNGRAPTSELPIQKASEPIDEKQRDSNKKKIDASKG